VDYIGVRGNSKEIFEHGNISTFFGDGQGKFFGKCIGEKLRTSKDEERYGVVRLLICWRVAPRR
jgi:hypothetical protein